jgi:cytidylate kinase
MTARPVRASAIALDGPAASGKSAVGSAVAARLGYRFFDTGAMYRAVTWAALDRGVDVHDAEALVRMVNGARIEARENAPGEPERTAVFIDGADATPHLRSDAVEAAVSLVSRVPGVRAALVQRQRALAEEGGVVMAGRDIGTVVLPDAGLKVYLDASAAVRAERRARQISESGGDADAGALAVDLARRDDIDSTRETSPLTAAADAVIINTDGMTVDEVVERIVELTA